MPDQLLVNSVYPIDYFALPGVDQVAYPDNSWWASKQRFASIWPDSDNVYASREQGGVETTEVLELDLGRIREINYINLDVLRAPINITIEYDAVSAPDRRAKWCSAFSK